ncbi:putative universal stress protein A family [Helianthus annuus]|uniref:Putative adenine nucleotide alpha hydrolases-like superfamily protein n=2 Tax=Helianthus annuus TaxID=4232 RepID=A0A251TIU6_HELAN|nr:putative universal stress protein A family [Helianthus annuus]KAJ0696886.1 putative universal stress protein A family [Helianthus annuus]KAJ0879636.1 putative universal stress protein A family [Helianthus annuus]KAJ0883825.1 putative universal stress protein A [Helianthus annuus]
MHQIHFIPSIKHTHTHTISILVPESMATKERKILVAVDESEESTYALSWCLKNVVTENSKDTLVLLYVKPPHTVYSALDGTGYLFSQEILNTMDKYRNDVAETVIQKAKMLCKDLQDVKVETRVEIGDPRDVICDVGEKMGVDMMVVGSHGYGLIKRAFLGSVSNHCAQNSKCPVLIVKKPKNTAANSPRT